MHKSILKLVNYLFEKLFVLIKELIWDESQDYPTFEDVVIQLSYQPHARIEKDEEEEHHKEDEDDLV